MLVFDDIQWADASSIGLIEHLADQGIPTDFVSGVSSGSKGFSRRVSWQAARRTTSRPATKQRRGTVGAFSISVA